jgi:hypothetical protein
MEILFCGRQTYHWRLAIRLGFFVPSTIELVCDALEERDKLDV